MTTTATTIPMRSGEIPVEFAPISLLLLTLLKKVAFHPTTIKSALVLGLIAAYLTHKFSQKKSIRGKTIVLTGAGNGLGRAQAVELAKNGCKVIIWDIDGEGLKKTVEIVKSKYSAA